jgi:hypothetical protein
VLALLIGQDGHDDGRRTQRQRRADAGGGEDRLTQEIGAAGDRRGADRHLQRAQPEHHAAQQAQPFPRQLQPDHEQQEDDAEFRQLRDLGRIFDGEGA